MRTIHTSAPWLMNTTKRFINNKGLAITDNKNRLICEVSHDLTQLTIEEYQANATLIAKAPNLLSENIENLEFLEWVATQDLNLWSDKIQLLYERISKTKEVIRKATE